VSHINWELEKLQLRLRWQKIPIFLFGLVFGILYFAVDVAMVARRGRGSGMQDGMLKHYLEQAAASDTNVEARVEREAFDFRSFLLEAASRRGPISILREHGSSHSPHRGRAPHGRAALHEIDASGVAAPLAILG
jgi:hypothetical protein